MKARIIFSVLFLIVVLGVCFLLPSFLDSTPQTNDFPQKLNTRVILTDEEDSVEYRMIEYADGREKLVFIRTDYRDGITVLDYFRPDGSLREETEYYPVSDTSVDVSERQVKRVSLFDSQGDDVISRHIYREDGTSDSYTRLRVDGLSETETYSADGKAIVSRELVTRIGKVKLKEEFSEDGQHLVMRRVNDYRGNLVSKDVYSTDGVLELEVKRADGEIHIVEYQDDGVKRKSLTVRFERSSGGYSYGYGYGYYYQRSPEYYLYQNDGVTLAMEVSYDTSSTTVKYFDKHGALIEKRVYSTYGRFTVTGYWANGEKRFEQKYTGPGYQPDRTDVSQFELDEATEFDMNGDEIREVEFYDNGNPRIDRTYDGVKAETGIKRTYDEDGYLKREVEVTGWHEYGEEKVYGEEEGEINEKIEADIPSLLTELEERQIPPKESELKEVEID